ncbi:MAG: lysophospholipid acyltransferase family protein [Pyrinomonadaceae bacterium]
MIIAKKSFWFEKLFAVYNRNLFKRRFNSLNISGLEFLTDKEKTIPAIIYANHSSWWDGLTAFEISRAAQLDSYVMMEEKQLKKLFPFKYLGAFSVVRENPREAIKSINYAGNLLREKPDKSLWIFPQGEILPNEIRPLKFYNGISRIIWNTETCLVFPAAIRYEFLKGFKPEIFVKIGKPESIKSKLTSKKLTKNFEINLIRILDEMKNDITNKKISVYKNIL